MEKFKKEITVFFTTLTYYTRIPCYKYANFSPEYLREANRYFPLMGWLVGGFGALTFILTDLVFPKEIALIFSMISTIMLTGAMHEDGFTDTVDGFGGGHTKEKTLEIMKDSRVGTYGAIGIFGILSLKFSALFNISSSLIPLVLIAGHSISRFIATTYIATHSYARVNDSSSKAENASQKMSAKELLLPFTFGILPVIYLGAKFLLALVPLLIIRQIVGAEFNRKLQGFTGDTLGAVQQLSEVIVYLSVLILLKF